MSRNTWIVLLAAGDGTRLRSLTSTRGIAVPKQFCSLNGGASLLQETLHRAARIASRAHICAVVAEQHRAWWEPQLWSMPKANVFIQPCNRGTAHGVLLPLLHILARDPRADVVLLPCDHYVQTEERLSDAIEHALSYVRVRDDQPVLLGMSPEFADPELGYVVPEHAHQATVSPVLRFVEKPSALQARQLIEQGALWNAFIIASHGQALLRLLRARMPDFVDQMQGVVGDSPDDMSALTDLYRNLPVMDFSKHVLQSQERRLKVLKVLPCGWSDLGTPHRIGAVLGRLGRAASSHEAAAANIHVNLGAEYQKAVNSGVVL